MIKYLRKLKLVIENFFYEKKYADLIKPNRTLYKKKSGKCFILGSGPSLKDVDLAKLKGQSVFAVNSLFKDPRLSANLIAFWSLHDIFVYPFTTKSLEIAMELDRFLVPGTKIFVPVQAKFYIEKYNFFLDKTVVYLLFSRGSTEVINYGDSMDLSKSICRPHNIVEVAIVCAIYMGFDEIVLLGCDSNWFMYDDFDIDHSYDNSKDECHELLFSDKLIHKNQPASVEPFDMRSMENKLMYGYLLYKNYRLLNEAAKNFGVRIYDCTFGGKLDMFSKELLDNKLQD